MLKIAAAFLAVLGLSAVASGAEVPSVPVYCQACQQFATGIQNAVSTGKTSAYTQITDGFCASLGLDAVSNTFCESVVATSKNALAELLKENTLDVTDACISLGACPAKACPAGLQRVGRTNLCADCTAAGETDLFGSVWYLRNSNATRICRVSDYVLVGPGFGLAVGNWITSDRFVCNIQNDCGAAFDLQIQSGSFTNGRWFEPYFGSLYEKNVIVEAAGSPVQFNVAAATTYGPHGVCVCSEFFRPWEYGLPL